MGKLASRGVAAGPVVGIHLEQRLVAAASLSPRQLTGVSN
ncbi:hypothetical protein SJ05684_b59530 (plasmid) [Sinorhizobium sojae CCBAU 05684]|uniref:Uncharacterized protein n=1 Tax=Sinorhizobium sojae CCBAU 05684 TaxID=716928 RepID=A0A249PMJ2_9HYPH|nr:hypothetical protein SJ05684_b59530 [Sinorhizobium sojae CCBAU 05684]